MFYVIQLAWSNQSMSKGRMSWCEEICKQVLQAIIEKIFFTFVFFFDKKRLGRDGNSLRTSQRFSWKRIPLFSVCGSGKRSVCLMCTEDTNPTENERL